MKRSRYFLWFLIPLAAPLAFLPIACGNNDNPSTPAPAPTITPTLVATLTPPVYNTQWTTPNSPFFLAESSGATFYVTEPVPTHSVELLTSAGVSVDSWLSAGTTAFSNPNGIGIDPGTGNVYVADGSVNAVFELTAAGVTLNSWTTYGASPLSEPAGLAVDASGNVYVAEHENNEIDEYNSTGAPITRWQGDGFPAGVAISPVSGNIYVSSFTLGNIHEYTPAGASVTQWAVPYGEVLVYALTVDASGNVYATGSNTNLVYEFDANGVLLTFWGSSGTGNGAFDRPRGILVSGSDVYVCDYGNKRIQVFGP